MSWRRPFETIAANTSLGEGSPWRGRVERLLWDRPRDEERQNGEPARGLLVRTLAAGVVAVHLAEASEGLTVLSVSADPAVARAGVLDAAHEVAAGALGNPHRPACSLFELPLGDGHSWRIDERPATAWVDGERIERVASGALPAWRANYL